MFSSTYNSNPHPCFLSHSYPPFPFLDPENTTIHHLLHDINPLGVHPFILPTSTAANDNDVANAPLISETVANWAAVPGCATMPKQDNHYNPHYNLPNFLTTKKAGGAGGKKDRHSKIYTSQGLRDRRVRLSIEIARKFFDLQDMLGFDKASNTLEWLFTKSKRAIKELAGTKHSCSAKSFSSSSECDEVVSQMNNNDIFHQLSTDPAPSNLQTQQGVVVGMVEDSSSSGKEKKLKRAPKGAAVRVAQANNESREKAEARARARTRARARERTSHKMCNTTSSEKKCPAIGTPQILHQFGSPIQNEACARSPKMAQLVGSSEATPRDNEFNVIEESIVIKRKLKPSSATSHNQNLAFPNKEASFNVCNVNDYHCFPNLPPNWDTNAAIERSSFCAIASVNLSTEPQIFGKTWEECNNPRPH